VKLLDQYKISSYCLLILDIEGSYSPGVWILKAISRRWLLHGVCAAQREERRIEGGPVPPREKKEGWRKNPAGTLKAD
jgi:hypothetical protein